MIHILTLGQRRFPNTNNRTITSLLALSASVADGQSEACTIAR